ncbi:DUF3102 domain-containing protein [Paenibacillus polymyxa]|uniref:DUF3102 domain-containing protein n=1 Tax=Paenibacillus polymyxa TaxID=1406 RepID=UPI0018669F0B|nr:DUF3102 domain-containing protein [Paenibacillus polymyxa]
MHGEWEKWLERTVNIRRQTANRMIQVYEQFGTTSYRLDIGKLFEMLSLPESVDRLEFVE